MYICIDIDITMYIIYIYKYKYITTYYHYIARRTDVEVNWGSSATSASSGQSATKLHWHSAK